jgi:hypothetical protein
MTILRRNIYDIFVHRAPAKVQYCHKTVESLPDLARPRSFSYGDIATLGNFKARIVQTGAASIAKVRPRRYPNAIAKRSRFRDQVSQRSAPRSV